jgi:cytochrome c oxidase cbb3-type subunit III
MSNAPRTDHAYDGIEEYDNPLPGWWKWLFVASIVYSPFYWIFYHSGVEGRSVEDQYSTELAINTRLQFEEIGELKPDAATIVSYMNKPSWVQVGKSVFKANCISCHGRDGEGQIGVNLTDESFKGIRTIEDIARIVSQGANNGAMPKWTNRLHPNEIVLVSSYVASLRGQNLTGPRPAEGQAIPPWPEALPEATSEAESDKLSDEKQTINN